MLANLGGSGVERHTATSPLGGRWSLVTILGSLGWFGGVANPSNSVKNMWCMEDFRSKQGGDTTTLPHVSIDH